VIDADRLAWSIDALADANPELSARRVLSRAQVVTMLVVFAVVAAIAFFAPRTTAIVAIATITVVYASISAFRFWLFLVGLRRGSTVFVTDEDALAIPDDELPVYTVLLPAYREPDIVIELVTGIGNLDYPRDKLDVRVLLEADDDETVAAARAIRELEDWATVELVPPSEPRTKPKACNWGLATARGEFVTIYDAEDVPEPLQLRRAVVAFRRLGPSVSCLQARLGYHNYRQNLLTRFFGIEYDTWFTNLLPGLAALGVPLPLGGTSNHLRTDVLRAVHGWDPYNVTEDADLGIRLNRLGYHSAVLHSMTLEEANSDVINWVKQRSRWEKGYLQTGLVHLRSPRRLVRELGWKGALGFLLLIPGTPTLAIVNAVMWSIALLWWLGTPVAIADLYPETLLHISLAVTVFGGAATIYVSLVVVAREEQPVQALLCLLLPLYWLLMTVAACKALIQLITAPSYWEKTTHGLDRPPG